MNLRDLLLSEAYPTGYGYFKRDNDTGEIRVTSERWTNAKINKYKHTVKLYINTLHPSGVRPTFFYPTDPIGTDGKPLITRCPFFVIDIDNHENTPASTERCEKATKEIKELLDKNNVNYGMETNPYKLGCKFWICFTQPVDFNLIKDKLKIICHTKIEKGANFEFYPKIKKDDGNFFIRLPGQYKDFSGYSIDVKTGEPLDTFDKVCAFFDKIDNDNPIEIINIFYEKYLPLTVEVSPQTKTTSASTAISSGQSNLVSCMQTLLIRFVEMINKQLDIFKKSTKPNTFDFCVEDLVNYVKDPIHYYFFNIAKIDFSEQLLNHLLTIKETMTAGINAWVKIEYYPEVPTLIKSISFFRNCDGGVSPIIFYEAPSFFSFSDFVMRLPAIKEVADLYKNTFAEKRFTKEGFVPSIKTTYRFRPDGTLEFSDYLMNAYDTATESNFWQNFSNYLYSKFCCKYEIKMPTWYGVRDMVIPTLRITNLKMLRIFDSIVNEEYKDKEFYLSEICKHIPLDLPKMKEAIITAGIQTTPEKIIRDAILEVAYRAASMAYNYLPRKEDVVGEDLSSISFLKDIDLPDSRTFKPSVSVVLTLVGEIGCGKSTITEALALGAMRSLHLDDLSNALCERTSVVNIVKGTPKFDMDLSACISYCAASILDDVNIPPDCVDFLSGIITQTICNNRWSWYKEILSPRPLCLFLGASCDFERFLTYKAGNMRRYIMIYLLRGLKFDAIKIREIISENFCMLVRSLIKLSVKEQTFHYGAFPKLFDVQTPNFKYLEVAVDNSSKEPHWLSVMEFCIVKNGSYSKQLAAKYSFIRPSGDRKFPAEIYSACKYLWCEAIDIQGVVSQIYEWLYKKPIGNNISITSTKKLEEILKRNNIFKIPVTSNKKTKSAYRFLVLSPDIFEKENTPDDNPDSIPS